jgi:protein involved in polysaccharide export with SLBB domain
MKTLLLLFSLVFLNTLLAQDLSPAIIQEINKRSKQDLLNKIKDTQEQEADSKKNTKRTNASDLALPTVDDRIDALREIEKQKKRDAFFGESFFKFAQVVPKTFGPVPDTYLLGAGDELIITLYGEAQVNHELTLDRDNNIFPETIGRINLGGLSFADAKKLLLKKYEKYYSTLKAPNAKTKMYVTVGHHRKLHVSILGEVNKPQNLILSSLNSVFDAVVLAEGPTKNAALRRIEIKRGTKVLYYDLYTDMIPSLGNETITLEDGDVIFVSNKKQTVQLKGGIRAPNEYEIAEKSTLIEMLSIAGGLTRFASEQHISIATLLEDKKVSISFPTIEERNKHILRNGDEITVREKQIVDSSFVDIQGSILFPGNYAYKANQTVEDYIKMAGGVKKYTFLKRVEVLRKINPKQYRSITLNAEETKKEKVIDGDIITTFSELDFIEERSIYLVSYQQGFFEFQFFENADIYDYIAKIGGIKYTEDPSFIEVVRLDESDKNNYAKEYKIQIDPSFLDIKTARKNSFKVAPDDIIIIRKKPSYEEFQTVKVYGEVQSVGSYPIVKKGEKLSDILTRARGLKNTAYVEGFKFLRKRSNDFTLINDSVPFDSISHLRIPIDFNAISEDPEHSDNIVVQDGDSIYVPRNPHTVIVQGEVNTPKAVVFEKGQSIDYYLGQAGGLTAYADGSRVQIIKANGKQLEDGLFSSDKINAGTIITVPKEKAEDQSSSIINTIFQSVSAIVTTLVLIKQL